MVLKLYADSMLPAQLFELPSPLMDLGSGPGMPGIPLKILRPDLEIWLAEGRGKRVSFLEEVVVALGLKGLHIIPRNIDANFTQPMSGVITRAVESIPQTLERVDGCLQQNGVMIFMKGPGCEAEIQQALDRFRVQYTLTRNHPYRLGQTRHERRLVEFQRLQAPPRILASRAAKRHRVTEIASAQNNRFKALKKILSSRGIKKSGQALMAGNKPVEEMIDRLPERCLAWITSGKQQPPPVHGPTEMEWIQLTDELFKTLDIFGTRSPLLCIQVPPLSPWEPAEGFPPGCSLIVPFQDPENIGAVIRSAAAFGTAQVILLAESAHPYHPKALRSSGGVVPTVHLRQGPSLELLPEHMPIYALSTEGADIADVDFPQAFGLLAGMEGPGLPPSWRQRAVRIPITASVESLNAATASAIALYEWSRRNKRLQ